AVARAKRPRRESDHDLPVVLSPLVTPSNEPCGRTSLAQAPSPCCFLSPRRPHTPTGCGHGGTRNISTSRRVPPRSLSPAAIAGVRGRHVLAEPVPLVGRGCGNGTRRLAWGKQKL